jgi:hypothetical protein
MANVVVSAIATFNGKALKKGQKDISAFDKSVKKLGRTFAATFGAYQLINFSKKAVQAFMADEKAAKSLEQQLKNTGYQFSGPAVEMYIANLQKTTGVLDDQLRPAFQQLLTVTGSLTTSQDALNTALNVSAATGKSLTEVTSALSRGYAGNTTGLSRLGAGLNKALLKTGDMDKIMAELNKKFAGQSAARLDTYAGKMDLLTAAATNAQEIIGKSLLDALTRLGDDNSIAGATKSMEDFATATSEVITGLSVIISKLKSIGDIPGIDASILRNLPYIGPALRATESLRTVGRENTPSQFNTVARPSVAEIQTQLKLLKSKRDELAILNKKNALENKNVEELKKKFDLERIGLTAALSKATDEETKSRLRAQLAILDNNDAMAKKILAEMEAAEALKKLAEQAKAAGMSITDFALVQVKSLINRINAQIEKINKEFGLPSTTTTAAPSGATSLPASYFQDLAVSLVGTTGYAGMNVAQIATERARESGNRSVDVNLSVSTPSGDRFAQLMAESIQVAGRSGYSTAPNGGLP